MVMFEAAFMAY